jgi:hypothetical protein
MFGKDQLKYCISEELQPLIIEMMSLSFMAEAGMSQRFGQKQRVSEFVSDALF